MLGLSFEKILMLALVAGLLLGPETLPRAAHHLGAGIRRLRAFASESSARARDEVGPALDVIDWKKLDPRQYDPRRIIRDALLEDAPTRTRDRGPSVASPSPPDALGRTEVRGERGSTRAAPTSTAEGLEAKRFG